MKKVITVLLAFLMLAACVGCGEAKPAEAQPTETPDPTETPVPATEAPKINEKIGFIARDDGDIKSAAMMHGFLKTAELLDRPSVLLRYEGTGAKAAVEKALEEGCKGILISYDGGKNADAIAYAKENGMSVVVPYDRCDDENVDANAYAYDENRAEEIALSMGNRMKERDLKTGYVLVYGKEPDAVYNVLKSVFAEHYPQYGVISFTRTAAAEEDAIAELSQFILFNRYIKGLVAADSEDTVVAYKARQRAINDFRKNGTPEVSPTPTPDPAATAAPDAASDMPAYSESLLKTILISVYGMNISDESMELLSDEDIYALSIEPFYESAVYSTMLLDRLLIGDEVETSIRIMYPIVKIDTYEQYLLIYEEIKDMFGLSGAEE